MNKQIFKFIFCYFILGVFNILLAAEQTGSIAGKVIDKNTGTPLPGVLIVLVGAHIAGCTNSDGTYKIDSIPPCEYLIKARLISYEDVLAAVAVSPDSTIIIDFSLVPTIIDHSQAICRIGERRDSLNTGILEGRVTDDSTKEPVISGGVWLDGTQLGSMCDYQGYYKIKNIPAGTYTIKVSSIAYYNKRVDSLVIQPGKTTRYDITLKPVPLSGEYDPLGPDIRAMVGCVYDGHTGQVIGGAKISDDIGNDYALSDSITGMYNHAVPAGIRTLYANAPGYTKWRLDNVEIRMQGSMKLDIVLFSDSIVCFPTNNKIKSTTIEGNIKASHKSKSVNGAVITIVEPNVKTQICNPENPHKAKYSVGWEIPGTYTIEAKLDGFKTQIKRDVKIVRGKTTKCDFNLIPESDN